MPQRALLGSIVAPRWVASALTTPQGQAADAQFVRCLMERRDAGVFTTVSALVDQLIESPAAKALAQEIIEGSGGRNKPGL